MDEQLLMRFLSRQCSGEDFKRINDWIQQDDANAAWLFEVERIWALKDELQFSDKEEVETAFGQFISSFKLSEDTKTDSKAASRIKSISFSWLRYAAAIIIAVLLSLNLYHLTKDESPQNNTIEVPKGQRVALTLSDGTKVWLNSDSRLTYPSNFSKKERAVILEGEGYFEVVKNAGRPFYVRSTDLTVRVLGTEFNFKAYRNEGAQVTLNEGKVEVSAAGRENKVILDPLQQVSYSKESGFQPVEIVDTGMTESWKKGELAFMGEPLAGIAKTLERRFDKEIIIKDEALAAELFTCRVKQDATLEQVFHLLKDTGKLDYRLEKNKVFIMKK